MSEPGIPLFHTPEEQRRISLDLMKRLLATIDEWGKAQGGKNVSQMRDVTVDALLRTITAICVYRELSAWGASPEDVRGFFRRINKEGLIEAEEPESLLALRARKDLLLRNLERAVLAF